MLKAFLSESSEGVTPHTWWDYDFAGHNKEATLELKKLFGGTAPFDTPKPVKLIQRLIDLVAGPDSLILDFFAGSSTSAEAVLASNAADGGNRRFIMVQIGESCNHEVAHPAGSLYTTIAEIGRERIRRAGRKLLELDGLLSQNLDVGFRVLKVDTSNMKDVYYSPDAVRRADLFGQVENIKPERTSEDLLFQVLLDWGVDLGLPIVRKVIDGKEIFLVDQNAIAACFDTDITEELVRKLAAHKPLRVVFRDSGFTSDAVKINVEQIFRLLSPDTQGHRADRGVV
jgi:adenine-specific DNA-methyltransferase